MNFEKETAQTVFENNIIIDIGFEGTPYKKRLIVFPDSPDAIVGMDVKRAFEQCKRKLIEDMKKEMTQ